MAESSPLDFAALIAPIDPANPAGAPLPRERRDWLDEARKEVNDPSRPAEDQKKADWNGIVREATAILTKTSKDVLVATRLAEALVKLHGHAGLKDGVRLLRELVESCWDRLNPPIEDGDVEVRAGPFHWLDDAERGARFPSTIRLLPLFSFEGVRYSWVDWAPPSEGRVSPTRAAFEKAAAVAPRAECERLARHMDEALEDLKKLQAALTAKMGPAAPGLTNVQQAITDCRALLKPIVDARPVEAPTNDIPKEGTPASAAKPARAAVTRADAYRQLAEAADLLEKLEPHSPIPHLVKRAVELGALPFPQLIKELVRDTNVLATLNRELGIKEPPAPQKK